MEIVSNEDLEFLAQQSVSNINMTIAGMTALMNENEDMIEKMESQNWFKRMTYTVLGKNKATKKEIQANHDKLNVYMSEAIAELYNRGCIHEEMIMSLGLQINELYAEHLKLKIMLGAFASKLNEKIISVDNYHILIKEIELGVYRSDKPIVSLCKILSMLDDRVISDQRKLGVLVGAMSQSDTISSNSIPLKNYLMDLVNMNLDDLGVVYMSLQNIHGNILADLFMEVIVEYHFCSGISKKILDKDLLINKIIEAAGINKKIEFSTEEVFDEFLNYKVDIYNNLIEVEEKKKLDYEHLIDKIKDKVFEFYNSDEYKYMYTLDTEDGKLMKMMNKDEEVWLSVDVDDIHVPTFGKPEIWQKYYMILTNKRVIFPETDKEYTYKELMKHEDIFYGAETVDSYTVFSETLRNERFFIDGEYLTRSRSNIYDYVLVNMRNLLLQIKSVLQAEMGEFSDPVEIERTIIDTCETFYEALEGDTSYILLEPSKSGLDSDEKVVLAFDDVVYFTNKRIVFPNESYDISYVDLQKCLSITIPSQFVIKIDEKEIDTQYADYDEYKNAEIRDLIKLIKYELKQKIDIE